MDVVTWALNDHQPNVSQEVSNGKIPSKEKSGRV